MQSSACWSIIQSKLLHWRTFQNRVITKENGLLSSNWTVVKSESFVPLDFESVLRGFGRRAGVVPGSSVFKEIVETLGASAYVSLYGFYCHAGDSYGSTSEEQASTFLNGEIRLVNEAAEIALKILPGSRNDPLVLSVGSTPTAHGATDAVLRQIEGRLLGRLELHAGTDNGREMRRRQLMFAGRQLSSSRPTTNPYWSSRASRCSPACSSHSYFILSWAGTKWRR